VGKRFRTCDLDQLYLLPPSLQDWLPENHLARFVADVMNELDLSSIYAEYERKDGRGQSAYHPLLLTRLLLYGYCTGITSSRRIERASFEDVAFRYLAANQHPDHDTIADFRKRHLEALAGLFVQALRLCDKAGLVKLGNVAIDGTKILANASTRRSVGHAKLVEREQYWKETVERLLKEAALTDQAEDELHKGQASDVLPAELADAQHRLERLRQARLELEWEAQQGLVEAGKYPPRKRGRPKKAEALLQTPQQQGERKRGHDRLRRAQAQVAAPTRQYNFVDPDSRVMKDNARKCFVQSYNVQVAADAHAQVIVAAEVTQQTTDRQQLLPMAAAVEGAMGRKPETLTADAGYWDSTSLHDAALEGVNVLVCPDSKLAPPGAKLPPKAPRNEEAMRMRLTLAEETGKALYAKRKVTVEPVFGQIKEARNIRRFRLRSLQSVGFEWKLICATHNLLKLFRHRTAKTTTPGSHNRLMRAKRDRRRPNRPGFCGLSNARRPHPLPVQSHSCRRRSFTPTGSQADRFCSILLGVILRFQKPKMESLAKRLRRSICAASNRDCSSTRADRPAGNSGIPGPAAGYERSGGQARCRPGPGPGVPVQAVRRQGHPSVNLLRREGHSEAAERALCSAGSGSGQVFLPL
jgi:transposase